MRLHLFPVQARLLLAIRAAIVGDGLLGPLCAPASDALPRLVVESADCVPWHSLTFTGHRHRLALRLSAPLSLAEQAQDRLEALLERLVLSGSDVLIESAVEAAECRIMVNGEARLEISVAALTIED